MGNYTVVSHVTPYALPVLQTPTVMPRINVPPATMAGIKEAMTFTSEKILRLRSAHHQAFGESHPLTPNTQSRRLSRRCSGRERASPLCQARPLTHSPQVRELYEVLKTATWRVANLLNESTPAHRLPPEILTRILYLTVDHGSEEHAGQVIPLTHVCRYWRSLLLSYPRMWSTLCMKPGNPSIVSEWLARSQNVPLIVIAEFTDIYEHPPCRYLDTTVAAIIAKPNDPRVCPRHQAALSLDQVLPHRSRIQDLSIVIRSSDSNWTQGDHIGKLLYHQFFLETLPNLRRLDFRAADVEEDRYMIPMPDLLFAGELPRLKELKYHGVNGGLTETAKDLTSCEIGHWSGSAGPTIFSLEELQMLFNNNKTLRSLTIGECDLDDFDDDLVPMPTPMTGLKFLKICCCDNNPFEKILNCIHVPQFENLDTAQLSFSNPHIQVVATDRSGHTLEFLQSAEDTPYFYPLRHFGADIVTLRLDQGMTLLGLDGRLSLYEFFQTLNAVQVLEFDGAVFSVMNVVSKILSETGVFPELKIIRVAVSRDDTKEVLRLLAAALRLRMTDGFPLATMEPLFAEVEDGLGRVEWERYYEREGIQDLLSK